MFSRIGMLALGILALSACAPHSSIDNGAVVLEEQVALSRGPVMDLATRELEVDSDSILVAIVDENLTDVHLRLAALGPRAAAIKPVEVENTLAGAGIEIAVLEVPEDTRVAITLTGPQNALEPGAVRLRVRQFQRDAPIQAQLEGYGAWSAGTSSSYRPAEFLQSALAELDRAIASFERPRGDPRLAAEALLVKANVLLAYYLNVRQSYETARRAVAAFAAQGESAKLQTARARLLEANALSEIAINPLSKNPTAEEARVESHRILEALIAEPSPLGPIERARALDVLGTLYQAGTQIDEATRRFEQARAIYRQVGHVAGETDMLAALAQMFAEQGQWDQAAAAFAPMLPNVQKITNPVRRAKVLLNAGHAVGRASDPDQGMKLLHDAIVLSREYRLSGSQAEATWELAWLYLFRGDDLQAKALFSQALKIARTLDNEHGLSSNLQTMGMMARREGDYATAIAMHQEAIPAAPTPFQRIRALRDLGLDYVGAGKYPEAIAQFRSALAIRPPDSRHHIFTDIKRDLAATLIEHDGSRAAYAEAEKLLADSLGMSAKMNDVRNLIAGHRVRARLLMKQGRYIASRAEFERCFELIFKYRQASVNPQLRMEALEEEQAAFRGYFDLMMRAVAAGRPGEPQPASADAQAALRMLERSRETRFGMPRPVSLDADASARIDALLAQMAERSLRISTLLARKLDEQERAQLDTLQLELSQLRVDLDRERTVAAARHSSREKPAAIASRPWRDVAPHAVQLSYALGFERAYVWVRDTSGLRVAVLSDTPEVIERDLTVLAGFDARQSPARFEQALTALSSVLLPARLIPPDSNALDIVAEGRIASVPFAGLSSPIDPARRLVETHALTVITSMYATTEPHRSPHARPFQLVALASGSGTLRSAPVADPTPPLQVATAEIQAIADLFAARDRAAKVKLFAGVDGDANTLRTLWSSGADVVHFATHALADLRQPLASLLVLPAKDAAGSPAYLTAGQVQEWRGDVGLVFLSACESAIGPPRFAGGMPGLQSAFLRAGARGVVATLWPIEDVMAREFTADFYQRFTRGESAAQALSATQRAWLAPAKALSETDFRRRRITALAHGYYTP
jgi:CHAT domain-containing protein/Tfp pilus assembly protein PilF